MRIEIPRKIDEREFAELMKKWFEGTDVKIRKIKGLEAELICKEGGIVTVESRSTLLGKNVIEINPELGSAFTFAIIVALLLLAFIAFRTSAPLLGFLLLLILAFPFLAPLFVWQGKQSKKLADSVARTISTDLLSVNVTRGEQTVSSRFLTVSEAYEEDAGRGIVRVDVGTMRGLGLRGGDVVKVVGKSEAFGVIRSLYAEDTERGTIRMNEDLRRDAGVEVGDKVRVEKVDARDARKITLILPQVMIGGERYLHHILLHRPVMRGQKVRVGAGDPLTVASTDPDGVVIVTPQTEIVLSSREELIKPWQEEISQLEKKHSCLYLDDVKEELRRENFARVKELLEEKKRMLDQREKIVSELTDIKDKLSSLSAKLADGLVDPESYRRATDQLEARKAELREELAEIDSKLYKEEYEKPV